MAKEKIIKWIISVCLIIACITGLYFASEKYEIISFGSEFGTQFGGEKKPIKKAWTDHDLAVISIPLGVALTISLAVVAYLTHKGRNIEDLVLGGLIAFFGVVIEVVS